MKPLQLDMLDIEFVYKDGKVAGIEIDNSFGLSDKYAGCRVYNEDVLKLTNWLMVYINTYIVEKKPVDDYDGTNAYPDEN